MKVVILAAGLGKRFRKLGNPKPLTLLCNGYTILGFQLHLLTRFVPIDNIFIVVGYQKEKIMEQFPLASFLYNPFYASTNTAVSLSLALRKIDENLLWLNGDVLFHPTVLEAVLAKEKSCMVVNQAAVGKEEVKYQATPSGQILAVSKELENAQGEALGINYLLQKDLPTFKNNLDRCTDHDFFEKAINSSLQEKVEIWSVPVQQTACIEIDFPEDLEKANEYVRAWNLELP